MRTILIFIIGGILASMVARLLRTVRGALPPDPKKKEPSIGKGKIIDAEFEDVDRTE